MMESMTLAKAQAIFITINDDKWTNDERIEAIRIVTEMETHNGITKEKMLDVIKWLLSNRIKYTNIVNAGHIEIDMR